MERDIMGDKPSKLVINKEYLQTKLDEAAKNPEQSIADADLDKVSGGGFGGIGGVTVGCGGSPIPTPRPDPFVRIQGPSFVKTIAYRKADWDAEPVPTRSVKEIYHELSIEPAGGNE